MYDLKMHDIIRTATSSVKDLLVRFPCVAVVGARQVGKTTLLKQAIPGSPLFDMEKRSDFERVYRDPNFFLSQYQEPIAIDEAQFMPELFPALRVAIDSDRRKNGRFLISGSSSPQLNKHIAETLAGRVALFELGGLSLEEQWGGEASRFYKYLEEADTHKLALLKPLRTTKQVFTSCLNGSYPEPFMKFRKDPKGYALWMENYIMTYVKRDIRGLFPGLNINAYQRFIDMLSASSGQILNVSEFARSLDVSQPTAKSYFDIAQNTYVWRMLPSYQKNAIKRIVKMPKGHVRDTGLLNHSLLIASLDALQGDPRVGRIWESFIIEQILKGAANSLSIFHPYYYRTSNMAEIDLILEGRSGIVPIEIKLGSIVHPRNLIAMESFINEHKLKFGIIINNAAETAWLSKAILQVPATCL